MRTRDILTLSLALVLAVTLTGCAALGIGEKRAATPAEQGLLDGGQALKELSASAAQTNAAYREKCPPAGKLDAATCNAWIDYLPKFQAAYTKADGDWRLARSTGDVKLQQDVGARAKALKDELQTYASKAK